MEKDVPELTPAQLYGDKKYHLIDVREAHELVGELGHIAGVQHIPLAQLLSAGAPATLNKDQPIVMVCRSGRRSAHATEYLLSQGFTQVFNLEGGMLAWCDADLPIQK